jgi:hypothetical protein
LLFVQFPIDGSILFEFNLRNLDVRFGFRSTIMPVVDNIGDELALLNHLVSFHFLDESRIFHELLRLNYFKRNFRCLAIDPIAFPDFEPDKLFVEADFDSELLFGFLVVLGIKWFPNDLPEIIPEFKTEYVVIVGSASNFGDSLVGGNTCIW